MTLKEAVQTLKISPPITRGELTKAYVDGLAEWRPERVAGDAALAAEAEGRINQISEAHGILSGLPESGYPFKVSAGRPREASAFGIARPLNAPKIAPAPPKAIVVPVKKAAPLTFVAYAVVGVAVLSLAGMLMHVLRGSGTGSVPTAQTAPAPQSQTTSDETAGTTDQPRFPEAPGTDGTPTPAVDPAGSGLTFQEIQTRALEGDKQAQWLAVLAYEKGQGVEASPEEALKWALMAAEQGLPAAQVKVGLGYKNGVGVAKDLTEAVHWLQLASTAGVENASYEAALCLLVGDEKVRDHNRAVALLRPLAEKGHIDSQRELGMCYRHGVGVPTNLDLAIQWLMPPAKHGHVEAQLALAQTYAAKEKTPGNLEAAVMWYRKAAEQQEPEAQYQLGEACSSGKGAAQSSTEAAQWWRLAAEQGHADAQDSLGMAYQRGMGVAENLETAVQWFRKAAGNDHAGAKFNLSLCYAQGTGVPMDAVQAAQYCQEAAELGHAPAQNNLGTFCMEGNGLRRDVVEASKWFRLALAQGHDSAAGWLAKVKGEMTPSQIAEGERRARAFIPRQRGHGLPGEAIAASPAQPPTSKDLPTDNRVNSGVLLTDNFRAFGGKGQLILDNGLVDDAYVKVVGGTKLWASFYVRGGEKFILDNVPDGTYQVLYCTGFDWDPKARDFGRDQHATKHERGLDFTTTRKTQGTQTSVSTPVFSLTLQAVPNGNAPTSDMSLEEFNRF